MVPQRHSRQRDAVYKHLCARFDHPTAEDIYFSVKKELPNLSLATVYRNLTQLCEDGKAQRIASHGIVRFDGNARGHTHLLCTSCGAVSDLELDAHDLITQAQTLTPGKIHPGAVLLYCTCERCASANAGNRC